jgi:hypothetical protein
LVLEFDQAVEALDEHIEVLKQELLFAMVRNADLKALLKLSKSKENWIKPQRRG